ncbi:MAG: hypothetical protein ABW215_19045 [Kibdelosporangium sp.]
MLRLLAILALIVRFALHRKTPDGPAPVPDPRRLPDDREKPSQQHGSINAGKGITSALSATRDKAEAGRPEDGEGGSGQPGTPAAPTDPIGGQVTHGRNSLSHMRSHAQHIRTAARADGVDIPTGVSRPETQQAIRDYIQYVVDHPEQVGVGRYLSVDNAIWSRRGDLIIVRKPDGEWITALSVSRGGAAGGAPWNNPNPPAPAS